MIQKRLRKADDIQLCSLVVWGVVCGILYIAQQASVLSNIRYADLDVRHGGRLEPRA